MKEDLMLCWCFFVEKSMVLIIVQGYQWLKVELDDLWWVCWLEVVKVLVVVVVEGDCLENVEYIYCKKQLGEIDCCVCYLIKWFELLWVVDIVLSDLQVVFFGVWVDLENVDSGDVSCYCIVGLDEIDVGVGWISIDLLLVCVLFRKCVDDEFEVELLSGWIGFVVLVVVYGVYGVEQFVC